MKGTTVKEIVRVPFTGPRLRLLLDALEPVFDRSQPEFVPGTAEEEGENLRELVGTLRSAMGDLNFARRNAKLRPW